MEELFKYGFNDRGEVDEMVDLIRDETLNVGFLMIVENTYEDLKSLGIENPRAIAQKLIEYFESTEEYEKCSRLLKFIKKSKKVINNSKKNA
tara:strand:- start:54 stop:329 length:276 start_codon:yes stop_codon:yes gene_type:complete